MCRLIETVCLADGVLRDLGCHAERMNGSIRELFGMEGKIDPGEEITVPPECSRGLYRCRILYSHRIESVEFLPYEKKEIRSLMLLRDDGIEYSHKFEDRTAFSRLLERKGGCDDILIVKNGFITDTSFSNVIFYGREGICTPRTPLLAGTKRRRLLESGCIGEADIRPEDLSRFTHAALINAMLDPGDTVLPVSGILRAQD